MSEHKVQSAVHPLSLGKSASLCIPVSLPLSCFIPLYTCYAAMLIELSTTQSCPNRFVGLASLSVLPLCLPLRPTLCRQLQFQPIIIIIINHKVQHMHHFPHFPHHSSGFSLLLFALRKILTEIESGGRGGARAFCLHAMEKQQQQV